MRKWKVKVAGGRTFTLESDDPGRDLIAQGYTAFALEEITPFAAATGRPARLRTATGALEIIRTEDPGTAVTLRCIRRLIAAGAVSHVPVGRKKLVNVDELQSYLAGGTTEEMEAAQ